MSIVGQWALHYSWGCTGGYNQTSLTFKNDGTFQTGDGFHGKWALLSGNVHWVYDPAPSAVYSGNVIGAAMAGLMTNFSSGGQGCWYATLPTIPAAHAIETKVAHAENLDSTGAKKK